MMCVLLRTTNVYKLFFFSVMLFDDLKFCITGGFVRIYHGKEKKKGGGERCTCLNSEIISMKMLTKQTVGQSTAARPSLLNKTSAP